MLDKKGLEKFVICVLVSIHNILVTTYMFLLYISMSNACSDIHLKPKMTVGLVS